VKKLPLSLFRNTSVHMVRAFTGAGGTATVAEAHRKQTQYYS